MMVLRQQGVRVGGLAGDPMVAHYLLHADEREHNMEALSRAYLGHEVIPITDLIGKKGKKQLRMDDIPTQRVTEYSGEDADVALRLGQCLESEVAGAGLGKLYKELEVPLIEVLAELEFNGIRIDVPRLRALGEEMAGQLARLEKEIYELAGREFNIASLNQLRKVLFDDLKLTPKRKTGITRQPSTDQETLEELAQEHPLPRKLLEQRKIAKLKSTYVDSLPELVNPASGRVHAPFNQAVAATGRLSSSDPNLQNIPDSFQRTQGVASARPSYRSPAGCCWPPTIRKSSCGYWPTSAATKPSSRPFRRRPTIHAAGRRPGVRRCGAER